MTTVYRAPTFVTHPKGLIGCYFETFPPTGEAPCDMTFAGNWHRHIPYEQLVPAGCTDPIFIYQGLMCNWGVQEFNGGSGSLTVEPPDTHVPGGHTWRVITTWMDGEPNKRDTIPYPGIPLTPEDTYCIQFNWKAYAAGTSPLDPTPTKKRSISSQITYRIGW